MPDLLMRCPTPGCDYTDRVPKWVTDAEFRAVFETWKRHGREAHGDHRLDYIEVTLAEGEHDR